MLLFLSPPCTSCCDHHTLPKCGFFDKLSQKIGSDFALGVGDLRTDGKCHLN